MTKIAKEKKHKEREGKREEERGTETDGTQHWRNHGRKKRRGRGIIVVRVHSDESINGEKSIGVRLKTSTNELIYSFENDMEMVARINE